MDVKKIKVGDLFRNNVRYLVPVYQRGYVWKQEAQWQPLWDDLEALALMRLDPEKKQMPHFTGAVVFYPPQKTGKRDIETLHVVDGQQRLITFQLILAAIYWSAKDEHLESDLKEAKALIFNNTDVEEEKFKVWPNARRQNKDRNLYIDILCLNAKELKNKYPNAHKKRKDSKPLISSNYRGEKKLYDLFPNCVPRFLGAFGFFKDKIETFLKEYAPTHSRAECYEALWNALSENFEVAQITLGEDDSAQSVNARGAPLAQTDLIKNNIFMRGGGEKVEKLFHEHWLFFETDFWEEVTNKRKRIIKLDDYFRCFLECKTGKDVSINHLFAEDKKFILANPFKDVEEECTELVRYAKIYYALNNTRNIDNPRLSQYAREIHNLDREDVFAPLFLALWGDKKSSEDEKSACLQLLFTFIVRREICGLTAKDYNKYFRDIIRHIVDKHNAIWSKKSLITFMLNHTFNTIEFPDDKFFSDMFVFNNSVGKQRYILSRIEKFKTLTLL